MDPDPGVAEGIGVRVRRWIFGWGFKQWRQALLVIVLACTAMFGGLDTVDTSVTTVKPGEEFNSGRFTTTIERARLVSEVRAGGTVLFPAQPGRRYLGVVARITNHGTMPGRLSDPVELRDEPASRLLGSMLLSDGSRIMDLGPGLTDEIVFVWELPTDALSVGDTVTVRMWKQVPRLNTTYGKGWVPSLTDYGQVVVPVGGQK